MLVLGFILYVEEFNNYVGGEYYANSTILYDHHHSNRVCIVNSHEGDLIPDSINSRARKTKIMTNTPPPGTCPTILIKSLNAHHPFYSLNALIAHEFIINDFHRPSAPLSSLAPFALPSNTTLDLIASHQR